MAGQGALNVPPHGFAIGVDLGTSNTVAVVRWPDGRTRPLLIDGLPILPSGVYLDEAGKLHAGHDAYRLSQYDPGRFEPNPKRRVDEEMVLLGDREVPTVDLLAALLGAIARAAVEAAGFLPPAALTYPAAWGPHRREALMAAAARAGWPPPHLVSEPVAAARYFLDVLRRPVPVGSSLAVFDFGGGTLDVAVVRNVGDRLTVLGSGGIEHLGGLDIDAALVDHLGRVLGESMPQVWAALSNPDSGLQRRNRRAFWDDVRGAKEMLSRTSVAPVTVPGVDSAVHLTRTELEHVAAPLLRLAVFETALVIRNCGLRPDDLAGLFLVGGSSRLPMAARLLHSELGIAPTVLEQPELPVAEGALAELVAPPATATEAVDQYTPSSGSMTVVGPPPVSPAAPAGVAFAPQPHARRESTAAVRSSPAASSPVSAPIVSPPLGPPPSAPPPSRPRPPGSSTPAHARRLGAGIGLPRSRRIVWIAATGALLAVALLVVAGVLWFGREKPVQFVSLTSAGPTVPFGVKSITASYSYVIGDRAYIAWQHDQTMELAALDLAGGRKLWQRPVPGQSQYWQGITATPSAIVAVALEFSDAKPRTMYVLNPADGTARWSRTIYGGDSRLAFDSVLVLASSKDATLRGLDWRTGNELWSLPDPVGKYGPVRTRTSRIATASDAAGPADLTGAPFSPDLADDRRLVQLDSDKTLRVIDAVTGKVVQSRKAVASPDDLALARDGKLDVVVRQAGYEIREYDVASLGEPQVVYSQPDANRTPVALQSCGADQVCVLDRANDSKTTEVAGIDVKGRKARWRRPAVGTETLVPTGDRVLATTVDGEPASALFAADGKQLLADDVRNTVGVRVNGSSVLLFSAMPSTYPTDVSLTGIAATDGARQPLGSLSKVRSRSCSWNEHFLVCAAEQEFRVWRFAK